MGRRHTEACLSVPPGSFRLPKSVVANETARKAHDRMPLVLSAEQCRAWLTTTPESSLNITTYKREKK